MIFEYKSSYIIVIPTGNKKEKPEVGEMGRKLFTLLLQPPALPPVSILTVIILFLRSEEVLLFLVLLLHINTHNRMEINL